jgi:soluble lytic murein transglycosylase-like protein
MHGFLGFAVLSLTLTGTLAASAQIPAATPIEASAQASSAAPAKDQARLTASDQETTVDHTSVVVGNAPAATGVDSDGQPKAESYHQRSEPIPGQATADRGSNAPASLVQLCDTLISSARDNDLPVVFFTNLIWQESRFNPSAVSRAGAQGMAQFMPKTAAAAGLDNPFDPSQALPASARLLRQLHDQFGNVGLAAAAYNAGPGRILKWLSNRGTLPQETRHYVATITGRPAEHWRAASADSTFRPSRDLPCSRTPAFAEFKTPAADAEADKEDNAQQEVSSRKPHPASTRNPRASLFASRIKPLPQPLAMGSIQRAPIVYMNRVPVPSRQRTSAAAQRASADGPRLARIKTNNALDKKRLATRGVVTITAKSVKLALVAPEPGQAARRQKKTAASHDSTSHDVRSHNKGRKVRSVRVASNS